MDYQPLDPDGFSIPHGRADASRAAPQRATRGAEVGACGEDGDPTGGSLSARPGHPQRQRWGPAPGNCDEPLVGWMGFWWEDWYNVYIHYKSL